MTKIASLKIAYWHKIKRAKRIVSLSKRQETVHVRDRRIVIGINSNASPRRREQDDESADTDVGVDDISEDAVGEMCGERKDGQVFKNFTTGIVAYHLKKWLKTAGITKHITFHCFRHTFATLQLAAGTDIYTISKLLTHSDVSTTQVYTDVVSSLKCAQNGCGASLGDVDFALNHSTYKMARVYTKVDYSPAWELNEKVIDYIFFSNEDIDHPQFRNPTNSLR